MGVLYLCTATDTWSNIGSISSTCAIKSGTGSPEGAVSGSVCDTYYQTDVPALWYKSDGTATNVGWKRTLTYDDVTYHFSRASVYDKVGTDNYTWAGMDFGGFNPAATPTTRTYFTFGATGTFPDTGDPTGQSFYLWDYVRNGAVYWVDATGAMTIGDYNTGAKLSVIGGLHVGGYSDPGDNNLYVDGTAYVAGGSLWVINDSYSSMNADTASDNPVIYPLEGFYRSRGTLVSPTTVAASDILGSFNFNGYTTAWHFAGGFNVAVDSITDAKNIYGKLNFSVNGGDAGQVDTFSSTSAELQFKVASRATAPIYIEEAGVDGTLADMMYFEAAGYPGAQRARLRASSSGTAVLNLLSFETSTGVVGNYNNQQLVLKGDNSVHASGNVNISGYVGDPDYVSQTTAWRVTDIGAGDFRYLFADEMHVKSFIADLEQALAGGQIIAKSVAMVTCDDGDCGGNAAFVCPAKGANHVLFVRDLPSAANMATFVANDWVVLRSFSRAGGSLTIADCVGQVTVYTDLSYGNQSWVFTRGTGTSGGSQDEDESPDNYIYEDALAIDYGVPGNGYYEVNAIDGAYGVNSPYAQIVTWETAPVAVNRKLRTRFGNLYGITGTLGEYGMIAGTYAATDGQFFRASSSVFELHGIDLKMWDGATMVATIARNTGAPYLSIGTSAPTAFDTGAGFWVGKYGTSDYRFRIGDPAGTWFSWDSSNGILIRNAATALASWDTAGALLLGQTGGSHLAINTTDGILIKNSVNTIGSWDMSGVMTLGQVAASKNNVYISSGSLYLRTNTTARVTLDTNGYILLGQTGSGVSNVYLDANSVRLRTNTTDKILLDTSGNLYVGDVASANTVISGDYIWLRNGATAKVTLHSTGLWLGESGTSNFTAALTTTYLQFLRGSTALVAMGTYSGAGFINIGSDGTTGSFLSATADYLCLGKGGVCKIQMTTADGLGYFYGGVVVGTSGYIASGASAWDTGVGFWMEYNAGTPRFRIGNPSSGARMVWDGSALTINGAITATSGSFTGSITSTSGTIGGWTLAANSLTSGSGATRVGIDSGGTNPAFYAGSETPGSAPFRVTNGGALTATSGTIGGWTIGTSDISAGSAMTLYDTGVIDAGDVEISSSGIELNGESATQITFNGTSTYVFGTSSTLSVVATDIVSLTSGSHITLDSAIFYFVGLPSTTSAYYPVVRNSGGSDIYYKTDGLNETSCSGTGPVDTITFEYGIATAKTCTTLENSPAALRVQIADLTARVAALESLLHQGGIR